MHSFLNKEKKLKSNEKKNEKGATQSSVGPNVTFIEIIKSTIDNFNCNELLLLFPFQTDVHFHGFLLQ